MPAMSRNIIRAIASDIHAAVQFSKPPFPIVEFAEKLLPKLLDEYQFEPVDEAEMGSRHGLTNPTRKLIQIRNDVYEGACKGNARDRMTIAHEVGHLFLHDEVVFARMVSSSDIPAYRSSEWQANCFGGELLVPHRWLQPGMNPWDVARECGVSLEAARIALKHK